MPLFDPYSGPWTTSEAAHLGRRAGFGATVDELPIMIGGGTQTDMEAAVDALVDYPAVDTDLENEILNLPPSTDNDRIKNPENETHVQAWWLYRMVHARNPLQEQLTLFLHDTLVSEWAKVKTGVTNRVNDGNDGSLPDDQQCITGTLPPDPQRKNKITTRLLKDQNELIRVQGNLAYRETLRSITRDPAMLIYLDNRLNKEGRAQENYAREVMELFSMGVGNYSEDDVREIARAFTGETIDNDCEDDWPYSYEFVSGNHDTELKTVFGDNFNFPGDGEDTDHVIDLILDKVSVNPPHGSLPATAIYMSWKMITWFVHETIPITHPAVEELATFMYTHNATNGYNYDIRETLRTLFKSQFFYDPAFRYTMYKHPADFFTMALRSLGADSDNYSSGNTSTSPKGAGALEGMGMNLFSPPNVAGWNHGSTWINSGNVIVRFNTANRLSHANVLTNGYVDNLIGVHLTDEQDHAGIITFFRDRLIQQALRPEEDSSLLGFLNDVEAGGGSLTDRYRRKVRGVAYLVMTLPQYQLK